MKKNNNIIVLMAVAALSLFSCTKENMETEKEYKFVDVVFSVSAEKNAATAPTTKTALSDNGKAVNWSDGDKVAVFDNIGGLVNQAFEIEKENDVYKLHAQVREGSSSFYSLYPYDANASISGSVIKTTLPQIQQAVAGSFGPGANLSVASAGTGDASLTYKNISSLIKFTLDDENVVSAMLLGNNNEKIAGQVSINYNEGEPTVEASAVSVTVKNDDGTALTKGATYYFAIAPVTFSNGFTLVLTKTNGTFAYRAVKKSVSFARKDIVDFGTLSSMEYEDDLYAAFMAGASIEIAGKTYNKKDFGGTDEIYSFNSGEKPDALSGKDSKDKGIFGWNINRIIFLEGTAPFSWPSANLKNSEIVLISKNPSKPASITVSASVSLRDKASVVMKGLNVAISSNNLLNNNMASGSIGDATKAHFDGCSFTFSGDKSIFYRNDNYLGYGIASIRMVGCKVTITTNSKTIFNMGSSTCLHVYEDVVFENNVFYSSNASTCELQVLSFGSGVQQKAVDDSAWNNCSMSVKNNIFYNVTSDNGLFRHYKVASLVIGGNIYYSPSNSVESETYALMSGVAQSANAIHVSGDVVHGLDGSAKWSYAVWGSTAPAGISNKLTNETKNPISYFNSVVDYQIDDDYKAYGPQL